MAQTWPRITFDSLFDLCREEGITVEIHSGLSCYCMTRASSPGRPGGLVRINAATVSLNHVFVPHAKLDELKMVFGIAPALVATHAYAP